MKNTETGRSMVEMLGVLAIIGVLSVAGIAGYTMAMNKYKANEILNAASQLHMLAEAADQGNGGAISDMTGLTTVGDAKLCANTDGSVFYYTPSTGVATIVENSKSDKFTLTQKNSAAAVTCS